MRILYKIPTFVQDWSKIWHSTGLGASHLHEWRERAINQFNYGGDLLHIDFLTIPGASVKHLRHAWNVEYRKLSSKIPVDVLLLAGTNDLMQSSNATNVQSVLSDMQGCIVIRSPTPLWGGGGVLARELEK